MKPRIFFLLLVISVLSMQNTQAQNENKAFKPTLKINGRIHYDFEFLNRNDSDAHLNGNEFRRLYISTSGKVAKNLKYKVETNFAHASIGFTDVYLKYNAGIYGNFVVGSYTEPTGLDMATSSKYIPFFERGMLTAMQNYRWGSGFHYENFKLLEGKLGIQLAYTNSAKFSEGFKTATLSQDQMNFVARLTGVIMHDKEAHNVLHLGVNYDHRPYADLKFRAENHMGADTDTGKYHYAFDGAKNRTDLGLELGATLGSISFQSEYKIQSLDAANKDYTMTSYYALASYFFTGEHRPYKHGSFGRVKPAKDIDNGGFGAIEVLARYSGMQASHDAFVVNADLPETIGNISVGLNWYLNSHTRFMYNYVFTDDEQTSLGNLTGHLFRLQVDF